ncbi:DgyrCDS10728 [Dimorphilus gyrociliatus]|uniref:DgyrCDS10728 n=1 Tax=Dimorphilus gyrociliatus TaxID=2664684 RepID=A0A7I8W661_9ANNE|nr:DgyrCDS10728 [Dimorphilus gyrociliatus]
MDVVRRIHNDRSDLDEDTDPILEDSYKVGYEGPKKVPETRRCKYVIEPLIFLVFSAASSKPAIVAQFVQSSLQKNLTDNLTNNNDDQTEAAQFLLLVNVFHSIPTLITITLLGPWSDMIGRKPVMYIGLIGLILDTLIAVLIVVFDGNIYYLYVSKAISGCCGGVKGFLFGSFSYIADRSPIGDRAVRIVVAEGIMILISAIVSVCIGFWIDASGFVLPFTSILSIYVISLLYLIFVPESLIPPPQVNRLRVLIRFSHFRDSFKIFLIQGRKGILIKICCAAFFLNLLAFSGKLNVLFLYVMRPPLNWDPIDIGIYAAVSTIIIIGFRRRNVK